MHKYISIRIIFVCRLRSPKSPDDMADMGSHCFTYAAMPHTGTLHSVCFTSLVTNKNTRTEVYGTAVNTATLASMKNQPFTNSMFQTSV